jgi:hypothetical protein
MVEKNQFANPEPIQIEGAFTSYGLILLRGQDFEIQKRSFMRYKPWRVLSYESVETLSLHPPHLVVRDGRKRVAITFLEGCSPLGELLAYIGGKREEPVAAPSAEQPLRSSESPHPHAQVAGPLGFLGWALQGGVWAGQIAGSAFGTVGAAGLLAGAIPVLKEEMGQMRPNQALVVFGFIILALSVGCLRLGYSRYVSWHRQASKGINTGAGVSPTDKA